MSYFASSSSYSNTFLVSAFTISQRENENLQVFPPFALDWSWLIKEADNTLFLILLNIAGFQCHAIQNKSKSKPFNR